MLFNLLFINKLFSRCEKIMEKRRVKLRKDERIQFEWKEAARRLDYILFLISTFTIIAVPVYFFVPYLVTDPFQNVNESKCGCK